MYYEKCLRSQILHMHIGSKAHVVGQVPSHVVWVVIDHDRIRGPIPIGAEANVVRRHVEIKSAKPEAARPSASKTPNVAAANLTRKVPMFPRMVETIVRIIAAGIMPHPHVIRVYVRCRGMPLLAFHHRAALTFRRRRRGMSHRRWAVRGNVAPSDLMASSGGSFMTLLLGENRNRADQ